MATIDDVRKCLAENASKDPRNTLNRIIDLVGPSPAGRRPGVSGTSKAGASQAASEINRKRDSDT